MPAMAEGMAERLRSGEKFAVTGYYSYAGHADPGTAEDRCSPSTRAKGGMLFAKGETVPKLLTCPHDILWKLDVKY